VALIELRGIRQDDLQSSLPILTLLQFCDFVKKQKSKHEKGLSEEKQQQKRKRSRTIDWLS